MEGKLTITCSIGSKAFSGSVTVDGEGAFNLDPVLPAGKAGAISATGVDGLVTGHGIVDTDTIDVHWTDPSDGTHKCRRKIEVDTAATNAITFDNSPAAEGDALPAEDTAVVVAKQVTISQAFSGDLLLMICAKTSQRSIVDFRDSGGSELAQKLVANGMWSWDNVQGAANPMAGDSIVSIVASNGSITATTLELSAVIDAVA
jgi:hypothetical protein